jgi:hypothetical protein
MKKKFGFKMLNLPEWGESHMSDCDNDLAKQWTLYFFNQLIQKVKKTFFLLLHPFCNKLVFYCFSQSLSPAILNSLLQNLSIDRSLRICNEQSMDKVCSNLVFYCCSQSLSPAIFNTLAYYRIYP